MPGSSSQALPREYVVQDAVPASLCLSDALETGDLGGDLVTEERAPEDLVAT